MQSTTKETPSTNPDPSPGSRSKVGVQLFNSLGLWYFDTGLAFDNIVATLPHKKRKQSICEGLRLYFDHCIKYLVVPYHSIEYNR